MQIQQDFTYLPRSAIAKFVQLCDVCSVRGKRVRHEETCCISSSPAVLARGEEKRVEECTIQIASKSISLAPSAEGEIEIATETSVSGSSSLQIESQPNPQIPSQVPSPNKMKTKGKASRITEKEKKAEAATEPLPLSQSEPNQRQHSVPPCSSTISEPGNQKGGAGCGQRDKGTEASTDPSGELYHQIHESVRHLLEGLTWEEMIQLYTETTDNAIIASPNALESILRLQ